MRDIAKFEHSNDYNMIVRDSYKENTFYGLDDFDRRYLRIIQAKFGCQNSYHTIPDRVKMEMAIFEWNQKKQKFILNEDKRVIIQLNQLENLVVSYSSDREYSDFGF